MKETNFDDFAKTFEENLKTRIPLNGQIELTYRCGYDCVHCYCKSYNKPENKFPHQKLWCGNKEKELGFLQWKKILDEIYNLGGVYLTLTGGDPLLHQDFLKIYDYARNKGFLVSIFTNASLLTDEYIKHFAKNRPFNIEITLNGITAQTYETISGIKGSFDKVMEIIKKVKEKGLPLVLKTNGLKENKEEILKIKEFIYGFLGKGKYKFDRFITAGLACSLTPTVHRLSPEDIIELESVDPDMRNYLVEQMKHTRSFSRPAKFLYQCNSWMRGYFINPYGLLQFCHLSKKYSTFLTKEPFKKGFYEEFPKLLTEKYKTNSKCVVCEYKDNCYHCPARAFLETGSEEAPVEYFCKLARLQKEQKEQLKGLIKA